MSRFHLAFSLAATLALAVGASGAPETGTGAPPPATDAQTREKVFNDLFAQLRNAPDSFAAGHLRALIERVWSHSGSPTADLLMNRAESALKARDNAQASLLLDRIVSLYPWWSQAWRRRAQSALALGDDEGAMLDLNRALQSEPRDFLAMLQLAELMRGQHKDGPALDLMRRALAVDPKNERLRAEVEKLRLQVEGRDI
jgi:tetratricopeptide (TPR) repeat protein